jgi:hypothetical protein
MNGRSHRENNGAVRATASTCVGLAELWTALPARLGHGFGRRIRRRVVCGWFARIQLLVASVVLVQTIEDRPELVGPLIAGPISPRCARPECDAGANQRDANRDQRDAEACHARDRAKSARLFKPSL